jgi:hypothetical protein
MEIGSSTVLVNARPDDSRLPGLAPWREGRPAARTFLTEEPNEFHSIHIFALFSQKSECNPRDKLMDSRRRFGALGDRLTPFWLSVTRRISDTSQLSAASAFHFLSEPNLANLCGLSRLSHDELHIHLRASSRAQFRPAPSTNCPETDSSAYPSCRLL